jgi:hypothetical protein
MILPGMILHSRANKRWTEAGLDSLAKCSNKQHFLAFSQLHDVNYVYNSRGFRDDEWPMTIKELKKCIWCFGDSFTVGLGSSLGNTWVNILQQQSGIRCINISMDGASNKWISRKMQDVIRIIAPTNIVVQWSYFHRDEMSNANLSDEDRKMHCSANEETVIEEFLRFKSHVVSLPPCVVHTFIPRASLADAFYYIDITAMERSWDNIRDESWGNIPLTVPQLFMLSPAIRTELSNITFNGINEYKRLKHYVYFPSILQRIIKCNAPIKIIPQIDMARDSYHYDVLTANKYVEYILKYLR